MNFYSIDMFGSWQESTTSDKPAIYFPAESKKFERGATLTCFKSDRKPN